MLDRKAHWENVFSTKEANEVSWFQTIPQTSLNFFKENNIPLESAIVDIGGGDSFLAEHLLNLGYTNITVLDISQSAINRAKNRIGEKASQISWVISDITEFQSDKKYDVWHDRAVFHFLKDKSDQEKYKSALNDSTNNGAQFFIGTFSENGPLKCSGIEIQQYSDKSLCEQFSAHFEKKQCFYEDHPTPFDTIQNFVFCTFTKKK